MTKKPGPVRVLMMLADADEDDAQGYAGPATVLTGLPRTIRRHELRQHAASANLLLEFLSTKRYMTIYIVRSVTWMRSIWRMPKLI